jgi:2-C-methyl-D-erythritol 4-phosphate cytidylyltransferase
MDTAVLIPAAGSGTRLGGELKQFRRLGGRPLVVQSLLAFQRHPEVSHLVVAVPDDHLAYLEQEVRMAGITKPVDVVKGGETRQNSVAAALGILPLSVQTVLVHDAVRPFIHAREISAVLEGVRKYGAAALAIPVTDTLRRVDKDCYGETVSRAGLYRMQTPQGFRRSIFEEAHREAARRNIHATDDVALVMELGFPVHMVEGSSANFKITTADDWELARLNWPRWQKVLETLAGKEAARSTGSA